MDMTDMTDFASESFDVVIDKAAMDALLSQEGDVWNPDPKVVEAAHNMLSHISRVLRNGGIHIQISFAQPHFRKKYLLGRSGTSELQGKEIYSKEYDWSFSYKVSGDSSSMGSFGYYVYYMTVARPQADIS
jgi:hypothetical protein